MYTKSVYYNYYVHWTYFSNSFSLRFGRIYGILKLQTAKVILILITNCGIFAFDKK